MSIIFLPGFLDELCARILALLLYAITAIGLYTIPFVLFSKGKKQLGTIATVIVTLLLFVRI